MGEKTVLYAYWASSCSWRVRAVLAAKRINFEERLIDIVKKKEQETEEYRTICPAQKVPALVIGQIREDDNGATSSSEVHAKDDLTEIFDFGHLINDGVTLVESMAILQYLEDTRQPRLEPPTTLLRARMREIVETVVAGIQPLQNVGLRASFDDDATYTKFTRNWTARGLKTLEELLSRTPRNKQYCVGDQLTLADICLVPQVYNAAGRHKININEYPTVSKLYRALLQEEVFVNTHPEKIKLVDSCK